MEASSSNVQRELSHRNTHSVDTQVTQSEDAASISDHNNVHNRLGPVVKDLADASLVLGREVHALSIAVVVPELKLPNVEQRDALIVHD